MVDEDAEHPLEVASVEDREPIEALRSDGADEAFGHVEPLQTDGLDREEVDRERAVRLREVAPGEPGALAGGLEPASLRSFRTVVAETAKPSPPSSSRIR
jgi:hypothetical protein